LAEVFAILSFIFITDVHDVMRLFVGVLLKADILQQRRVTFDMIDVCLWRIQACSIWRAIGHHPHS